MRSGRVKISGWSDRVGSGWDFPTRAFWVKWKYEANPTRHTYDATNPTRLTRGFNPTRTYLRLELEPTFQPDQNAIAQIHHNSKSKRIVKADSFIFTLYRVGSNNDLWVKFWHNESTRHIVGSGQTSGWSGRVGLRFFNPSAPLPKTPPKKPKPKKPSRKPKKKMNKRKARRLSNKKPG